MTTIKPDPRLHPNAKFQPTEKDFRIAYALWLSYYAHHGADEDIEPFLSEDLHPIGFGQFGRARKALLRTTTYVAKRLGITRQSYAELEKSERTGKISIEKLQSAACALDCELLYALRPKQCVLYSKVIFDAMMPFAVEDAWTLTRPKMDKSKALFGFAKRMLRSAKFRRQLDWNERLWLLPENLETRQPQRSGRMLKTAKS